MRVVHVAPGNIPVPPNQAGALEKIIYQLTKALSKLNFDIHIIDIKADIPQRKYSEVTFHEVWNPPLSYKHLPLRIIRYIIFSLLAALKLYRLNKKKSIDIIHTHNPFSGIAILVTKRVCNWKIPIIHTTHCHDLVIYPNLINKLKYFLEYILLKKVNYIIAETGTVHAQLISKFKIPNAKISQIFAGVETEEIDNFIYSNSYSNSPQYEKLEKKVFYPARICPMKNQLALVKAASKVRKACPTVKFIFTGPIDSNPYYDEIQRFIKSNNFSSHVKFLGDIPLNSLYKMYQDASIFAFPTLYEIQGIVLLEAMAFELPIIASRIGPIEDVVSLEEGSAILIDPHSIDDIANTIILLLQDETLRQELSSKGKKLVLERFSWDKIAKETLALYHSIVDLGKEKQR